MENRQVTNCDNSYIICGDIGNEPISKISINIIVSEYLEIAESFHKIEEIKFINPIIDKIHKSSK